MSTIEKECIAILDCHTKNPLWSVPKIVKYLGLPKNRNRMIHLVRHLLGKYGYGITKRTHYIVEPYNESICLKPGRKQSKATIENMCPICCDLTESCKFVNCGHKYCEICALKIFETSNVFLCSYCRVESDGYELL